jgi:hypothetical protein
MTMMMTALAALLRNTKTTFSYYCPKIWSAGQQYHSLVAKEMVEAAGDRPVIPH